METIVSLVTKPINQNVGIIRISGPETFKVLKKIYPKIIIKENSAKFYKLYLSEKFIDDTIVLIFKNPNSFTGEDLAEIQFHGSIFIAKKILNFLYKEGIRQSTPGEFMKQAVMNGKIDLSQSEAINSLILTENEKIANVSSRNLNGEQSIFIKNTIDIVEDLISRMQVAIDYPENTDLPEYNLTTFGNITKKLIEQLEMIIEKSKKIIKINDGIKISIIGKPNAGKSTLFNLLLNEDKAIISNIKGTTRDVVEGNVYFDGVKILFQDTAGIRKSGYDEIEGIGIKKTQETIIKSDIIILLLDPSEDLKKQINYFSYVFEFKEKVIPVISKNDLISEINLKQLSVKNLVKISSKDRKIEELESEISKKIEELNVQNIDESPLLTTENQISEFERINEGLMRFIEMLNSGYLEDILFFELEDVIRNLNKIIGKEIDPEYFTNLFQKFCIGK